MLAEDDRGLECLLAAYYRLRNGTASRRTLIGPLGKTDREEVRETAQGHILNFAAGIRAGEFPVAPASGNACRSCGFGSVCRYVQWRCREKMGVTADE